MYWKQLLLVAASTIPAIQAAEVLVTVYPQATTVNPLRVTRTRGVTGTTSAATAAGASASATGQTTAITDCHYHGNTQFCVDGNGGEGVVVGAPTNSASGAASYTGCHVHDATETFCLDSQGEEVQFVIEGSGETESSSSSGGKNCHFHAGVEHCVGGDGEEETSCERTDRDYNIPLRIGLIFAILFTSLLGALGPILINKVFNISTTSLVFVIIKQFGTGIIISTAFVHLITHASLMWSNKCLGELTYESTGTAITMAGLFLAFLIEYGGKRMIGWRHHAFASTQIKEVESQDNSGGSIDKNESKAVADTENQIAHDHHGHGLLIPDDKLSVLVMEAGIIFHSILIGITLVVAGDSFFITLFIVILFHQIFEGLALGSRIAELSQTSFLNKVIMALGFGITTPVGMAIGTGVLTKFNGNDKSTIIALGTLDSFSAGVLIWTGVVEMWVNDWLFGALSTAKPLKTSIALVSLIAGMILMSVLGKWA